MKRIISICALLCATILTSCNSNENTINYKDFGLNTPVQSIKVTIYEAGSKFGEVIQGNLINDGHYTVNFNDEGYPIKLTNYDDDGDITEVTKYDYDKDNHLVKTTSYDEVGGMTYEFKNNYDGDIITSSTTTTYWGGIPEMRTTKYTYDGDVLIEERTYEDGELLSVYKYIDYKRKGANWDSSWVAYDAEGEEQAKGFNKLNDAGKIAECKYGEMHYKVKWNDDNLPIRTKNAVSFLNGVAFYYSEGADYTFEYEFDDKGNWIKQTIFVGEDREPAYIAIRKIRY